MFERKLPSKFPDVVVCVESYSRSMFCFLNFVKKVKNYFDDISYLDLKTCKDFLKFNKNDTSEIYALSDERTNAFRIIAYPDSDIQEILAIMKCLKLNVVPVAKNPWNKELIGYLKKSDIEKNLCKQKVVSLLSGNL